MAVTLGRALIRRPIMTTLFLQVFVFLAGPLRLLLHLEKVHSSYSNVEIDFKSIVLKIKGKKIYTHSCVNLSAHLINHIQTWWVFFTYTLAHLTDRQDCCPAKMLCIPIAIARKVLIEI